VTANKPTCGTCDRRETCRAILSAYRDEHVACKLYDFNAIREECARELRQEHMRDQVRNGERTADGRAVKDGGI
jgi:hypothetical protein